MIITGYQGIGKSTCARKNDMVIDLESSSFWKYEYDGLEPIKDSRTRDEDWYICYCQVAEDLSRQGYTVFVSCHPEVREWLSKHHSVYFCAMFPNLHRRDEWIERLKKRYYDTKLDKDFRALEHAEHFYNTDITQLLKEVENGYYSDAIAIDSMEYDLMDFIDMFKQTPRYKAYYSK